MASNIFGTPEENPPSWAKSAGTSLCFGFETWSLWVALDLTLYQPNSGSPAFAPGVLRLKVCATTLSAGTGFTRLSLLKSPIQLDIVLISEG